MSGRLICLSCVSRYHVKEGIPTLLGAEPDGTTRRTAQRFGYLWKRAQPDATEARPAVYHVDRLMQRLMLPPLRGLVLDAGCGEGIDLANQATQPSVELIGVELSRGGVQASFERLRAFRKAHVVQADLRRLPFEDHVFDLVYSYGVLHHLPVPHDGLRELVRVLKPGGRLAIYLYEDFSERAPAWRWLLALANHLRQLTTRLPAGILYRLCQTASPLIFVSFAVPARMLRRLPGCRSLAESCPFRHAKGPWSLTGDLYDRFSAPVEWRYNRTRATRFLSRAGLDAITTVYERGWMVSGIKPAATEPVMSSREAR